MKVISESHYHLLKESKRLFLKALEEDHISHDLTSFSCISSKSLTQAYLMLKEDCCLAGLKFIPFIFHKKLEVILLRQDGEFYEKGTIIARIFGPARYILSIERTLLNFIQHLCGIATITKKCVDQVKGFSCDILDTRKTIPGMRCLQKYAVKQGGGKNHRIDLEEQILIKNNHLSFMANKGAKNPIADAIESAKKNYPSKRVQIEIDHPRWIDQALLADAILLDNMDPLMVKECCNRIAKKVYVEASGGITLDNVLEYAKAGVDGVSMGHITHSVTASDICLRLET